MIIKFTVPKSPRPRMCAHDPRCCAAAGIRQHTACGLARTTAPRVFAVAAVVVEVMRVRGVAVTEVAPSTPLPLCTSGRCRPWVLCCLLINYSRMAAMPRAWFASLTAS